MNEGGGPSVEELLQGMEAGPGGGAGGGADGDKAPFEGEEEEGFGGEGEGGGEDPALAGLPFATLVVEQSLTQRGNERRRLVATLKVRRPASGELDIEVRLGGTHSALA